MKKKHVNIALVVILVLIWGAIIRKHFGNSSTDSPEVKMNLSMNTIAYKKGKTKDTFQLKLTNTNPFKTKSRKRIKKQGLSNNVTPKKTSAKKPISTKITWPKLSYHGFVKGSDKKTRLAILKVNNRLYRKREKEKIDELTVVKAYEDSVIISNNNEKRTIQRIHETL